MKNRIIDRGLLFLFFLTLTNCAIQVPPPGGPKDTTPPQIVETFPKNGTKNFNENYLEFTFSEYVEKQSVREAIFISPVIGGNIEYDWSGKSIKIEFQRDSLKKNTTYVVTLGTDVKDLNNRNRLKNSYILKFSTGNRIDNGKVKGKIFDKEPEGAFVYAYKIDSSNTNIIKLKPNYISQVGKSGEYFLDGLAKGTYRFLAIRDVIKNFKYDLSDDDFGFSYRDINVTESDTLFENIDFKLTRSDTALPHLVNATMTDQAHILLEFSEQVDSTIFNASKFEIIDTVNSKTTSIKYVYKGKAKETSIFIAFADFLDVKNDYVISVSHFFDKAGNKNNNEKLGFVVNTKPDTGAAKIIKITNSEEKSEVSSVVPKINCFFDDGVSKENFEKAIKIIDQNNRELPFKIRFLDDASFVTTINKEYLKSGKTIKLQLDMNLLKDVKGNSEDSTYTFDFKVTSGFNFSGVSGSVTNSKKNSVVVAEKIDGSNIYKTHLENDQFNFSKVLPGKYFLWIFADADSNFKYSNGSFSKKNLAEKFRYFPDTLNLRARWPTGKVVIDFSN